MTTDQTTELTTGNLTGNRSLNNVSHPNTNTSNSGSSNDSSLTRNQKTAIALTYWQIYDAQQIAYYASPIIMIVGTFGNLFAVVVLQNRLFKSSSTSFILTMLSFCDVLVLDVVLLPYCSSLFKFDDIRLFSTWSCKIHVFVSYLFKHMASWALILLTVERTISVLFPFKCKQICSRRNIIIAWIIISVVLVAFNIQLLVSFALIYYGDRSSNIKCFVYASWANFFNYYWYWIDACLGDFIPFPHPHRGQHRNHHQNNNGKESSQGNRAGYWERRKTRRHPQQSL